MSRPAHWTKLNNRHSQDWTPVIHRTPDIHQTLDRTLDIHRTLENHQTPDINRTDENHQTNVNFYLTTFLTGQVKLKMLIHQAYVRRSEICSILLFLDLLDRDLDLDQGAYPLFVGLIPDMVLPGKEEELIIAHTLLLSCLLTISLIKDIIKREDISLDLLPGILIKNFINALDLHHHLALLQEETRRENLFLDILISLINHVLLQEKTPHKQI